MAHVFFGSLELDPDQTGVPAGKVRLRSGSLVDYDPVKNEAYYDVEEVTLAPLKVTSSKLSPTGEVLEEKVKFVDRGTGKEVNEDGSPKGGVPWGIIGLTAAAAAGAFFFLKG